MTHAPVDLRHPDVTITIQIYEEEAYLFARRVKGPGGLPVGSSGRVLVLFSGGIDSPVAAHLMMKRGCAVDFLHFHLLRGKEQIRSAKIIAMARQVLAPHRVPARVYMASAAPFEAAMAPLDSRVATVVFRRFIMRTAERVARHRREQALITGESVGQVASQTLKNISVISRATNLPILRPLIALDKIEIIGLAKEIGTYELSIQPYQDPCSLHARNPATWAKMDDVLEVEEAIDVRAVVEETLSHHIEEIRIGFGEGTQSRKS
jgi:thiamine biosynthesis protein ThiI